MPIMAMKTKIYSSKTPKTLTGIETGRPGLGALLEMVPKRPKPLQGLKRAGPDWERSSKWFQNAQNPYRD